MLILRNLLVLALALGLPGCAARTRNGSAVGTSSSADQVTLQDPTALAAPPGTTPSTSLGTTAAPVTRPALKPALPAAPSAEIANVWIPLAAWCATNNCSPPRLVEAGAQPVYAIDGATGKFTVRVTTQLATWDGLEIRLGYAPQMANDQPMLHALDLAKTVKPLLTSPAPQRLPERPTIVLDPGHGGTDAGAKSVLGPYYEKSYTLDLAFRLRDLLTAAGWRVHLTRTRDVDMPLADRVAFAERHRADLFVSLHFNSLAPNQVESGLETYCLTPAGLPSNLTRGYADDLTQVWPNNAFDVENLHLAARVHRALLRATTMTDRGIRRARFLGVLRNQNRPAILVEAAYISNPSQAQQVASAAFRQKLAEGLAGALLGSRQTASEPAPARATTGQ